MFAYIYIYIYREIDRCGVCVENIRPDFGRDPSGFFRFFGAFSDFSGLFRLFGFLTGVGWCFRTVSQFLLLFSNELFVVEGMNDGIY